MVKKSKIDYDEEYDSLLIYGDEKAKDSLEIGNFIVDFNSQNKIVGVEILDFSSMIKIPGVKKEQILNASIAINPKKKAVYIYINILMDKQEKQLILSIPKTIEMYPT